MKTRALPQRPNPFRNGAHPARLQDVYQAWLDNLPDRLAESATAHKQQAICTLDFADPQTVEPPRGFGRD